MGQTNSGPWVINHRKYAEGALSKRGGVTFSFRNHGEKRVEEDLGAISPQFQFVVEQGPVPQTKIKKCFSLSPGPAIQSTSCGLFGPGSIMKLLSRNLTRPLREVISHKFEKGLW